MDKYTQGRVESQVWQHRQQILEGQDLCLTELLPKEQVEALLSDIRSASVSVCTRRW